ncbi:Cys-tRNA(Pro) deacylase [Marinobacter confluentis]|uniref:Cys-tRNA(Pro)/Cys-tRNA(Cys) deacylase n=1 Tax=Marinobacter confluentis TaxID=1697557 RepID=A0A4Z1C8R0_9GAMM|nr:Cys-tRNA(Pro) deacylase [Marinobacter confluentis]TGN39408.1 Cys-tRNA(Pro) deacylase [Marinobacter confluentis]
MTPGIKAAERAGIAYTLHDYQHDPETESFGLEAAEKLEVDASRVFKTLVANLDGKELIVGMVPVDAMLSLKELAKAARGKKAVMADRQTVERSTGYVLGGVSALGQKKRLRTFIDESANSFETLFISAGRRGLEIELAPADLAAVTGGRFAPLKQR